MYIVAQYNTRISSTWTEPRSLTFIIPLTQVATVPRSKLVMRRRPESVLHRRYLTKKLWPFQGCLSNLLITARITNELSNDSFYSIILGAKPISPKTLFEKFRKKGKPLYMQSMFTAKQAGCDAKVINKSLFIDNNVFNISNIPVEYQVAPT